MHRSSAALRKRGFTWRENSSALKVPQMWTEKDIQEMERPILKLAQFHCLPFESIGGKPSCCQGFVALPAKQPNQWRKARTFPWHGSCLPCLHLPLGSQLGRQDPEAQLVLGCHLVQLGLEGLFHPKPKEKIKVFSATTQKPLVLSQDRQCFKALFLGIAWGIRSWTNKRTTGRVDGGSALGSDGHKPSFIWAGEGATSTAQPEP